MYSPTLIITFQVKVTGVSVSDLSEGFLSKLTVDCFCVILLSNTMGLGLVIFCCRSKSSSDCISVAVTNATGCFETFTNCARFGL